jgi:hypothetical protein
MRNTLLRRAASLGVIAFTVCGQPAFAEQMTKNQYATYWRDACLAKGKSKKITLTALETITIQDGVWLFVEAYHSTMQSAGADVQSLKALAAEKCACLAIKIASGKKDLTAPTPDSAVDAAMDACVWD